MMLGSSGRDEDVGDGRGSQHKQHDRIMFSNRQID